MSIVFRKSGSASKDLIGRGSETASVDNLALVHVTWTGFAREIVRAGQLEPRPCDHFDENLLYFFLLRPAYGKKTDAAKSDQISRFPAVFIVDPSGLSAPFHVYPFDTGGALTGVFGDTPNPTVFLDDYELEPHIESAASHMEWAFGDRRSYFKGALRQALAASLPHFDEVGLSYISIARLASSQHNAPDQRASSIEIAFRENVPLSTHCPAVVIPKQYLEDGAHNNSDFVARLVEQKIDFRTYNWQPNFTPSDYRDTISRIVGEYLEERGFLNEC